VIQTSQHGFGIAHFPAHPYSWFMIVKLYWATRLLGYVLSLAGIFYYLHNQANFDERARAVGLTIVGAGFLCFFVSYALRAWLRFGPKPRDDSQPPDQ